MANPVCARRVNDLLEDRLVLPAVHPRNHKIAVKPGRLFEGLHEKRHVLARFHRADGQQVRPFQFQAAPRVVDERLGRPRISIGQAFVDRHDPVPRHVQQVMNFPGGEFGDRDDAVAVPDRLPDLRRQVRQVARFERLRIADERDVVDRHHGLPAFQRRPDEIREMIDVRRAREPVVRRPVERLPRLLDEPARTPADRVLGRAGDGKRHALALEIEVEKPKLVGAGKRPEVFDQRFRIAAHARPLGDRRLNVQGHAHRRDLSKSKVQSPRSKMTPLDFGLRTLGFGLF